MKITLMRHGAVAGPAALYGHTDIACSEAGLADLEHQYQQISNVSEIITSPKKRCLEFAEKMAVAKGLPITIVEDLKELSFGDWDGIPFDDLQNQWQDVERYLNNPETACPPNGEPLDAFYNRVSAVWLKLTKEIKTGSPLILCHGAVIRMVLANIMEMHFGAVQWFSRLDIRYASITQISLQTWDNKPFFRIHSIGSKH